MFPSKGRKYTGSSYYVYETWYSFFCFQFFLILSTFSGEWCDLQFHYFQNPCIYGTKLNWRVLWLMNAKKKIHLPWSPSLVLVQDWTDPANCKIFSPSLIFDKFWQIQQAVKSSVLLWYLINLTNSASEWGHCQTALSFVFFYTLNPISILF